MLPTHGYNLINHIQDQNIWSSEIFFKAPDTGALSVRKALLCTAICAVLSASALKVQTQDLLLFCQPATISTSE